LRNRLLFLSTPRDQVGAEKDRKTASRLPIIRAPRPIGIRKKH
jgi:hypothetical protein